MKKRVRTKLLWYGVHKNIINIYIYIYLHKTRLTLCTRFYALIIHHNYQYYNYYVQRKVFLQFVTACKKKYFYYQHMGPVAFT